MLSSTGAVDAPPSRKPGWESRLATFVKVRRHTSFAWGSHDCCTFASDWVGQARGTPPFPELRGHRTAFAATRALVRHGCRTAADIATLALGPPLERTAFARRGDIVSIDIAAGKPSLGLCLGQRCAFAGAHGLEFVPLSAVKQAWRV